MDEMRVDGRVCIHDKNDGEGIKIDVNFMIDPEAATILRHIASFIRTGQGRYIDDARDMKFEPTDDPRVCIVWNPNTRQIRFSTIGIDFWKAEYLCEWAASYLMNLGLGIAALGTPEEEQINDRTNIL